MLLISSAIFSLFPRLVWKASAGCTHTTTMLGSKLFRSQKRFGGDSLNVEVSVYIFRLRIQKGVARVVSGANR